MPHVDHGSRAGCARGGVHDLEDQGQRQAGLAFGDVLMEEAEVEVVGTLDLLDRQRAHAAQDRPRGGQGRGPRGEGPGGRAPREQGREGEGAGSGEELAAGEVRCGAVKHGGSGRALRGFPSLAEGGGVQVNNGAPGAAHRGRRTEPHFPGSPPAGRAF